MNNITIQPFHIIGISIRTTNENKQAAKDIPALWDKFLYENVIQSIPNKIDSAIYCVYTDYEKDHTKPYTTLLGCKVSSLVFIPQGMTGKTLSGGRYTKYTAKGKLSEGIIFNEWTKIWDAYIPRAFTADFEVYGEKAQNPEKAEVDIFVAVK